MPLLLDYASPSPRRRSGILGAALVFAVPVVVFVLVRIDNQRRVAQLLIPPPAPQPIVIPSAVVLPLAIQAIDIPGGKVAIGSSFLVAPDVLVTAAHIFKGNLAPLSAASASPDFPVNLALGRVIDDDPASDLALVAVLSNASEPQPVPLKLSATPATPGQRVTVLSRFGVTSATVIGPVDDPVVGAALLLDAPGLGVGASGAAVVNVAGEVVAIVRGAVDDDAAQVVAVPVARLVALMGRQER